MRSLLQPGIGAATGGAYVERKKQPPQPRPCVVLANGSFLDFWDDDVQGGTADSLRGGNMSMSREILFEVGLFDEGYIGRSNGEGTVLWLRILCNGYQIAYDPAAAVVHLGQLVGGAHTSKGVAEGRYYGERHQNDVYFFAKNFRQRYLPWFLKRELRWILVKQAIFQRDPGRTIASLLGLWRGYWTGMRKRRQMSS